jgi:transcriptional regulator with XRE-family HTH domain
MLLLFVLLQKVEKLWYMNFREKIKMLCRKRGITQKELAIILGITDISLNQTLRGQYPQLQTLEKIANALDVPISELFDRSSSDTINCPHCGGVIKVGKG